MADSVFRLACSAGNLAGTPDGWLASVLQEGELALLVDDGGFAAVSDIAHALDVVSLRVLRTETSAEEQERSVMRYAGSLALIWVAGSFSELAVEWAHDRGPMTLLIETSDALAGDERKRLERFVVILGRQAE